MLVRSAVLIAFVTFGALSFGTRVAECQNPASPAPTAEKAPDLTDAEVAALQTVRRAGKSACEIAALEKHPAYAAGRKRAKAMLGFLYRDTGRAEDARRIAADESSYIGTTFELLSFVGWSMAEFPTPNLTGSRALLTLALGQKPDDVEAQFGLARAIALETPSVASARKLLEFKDKKDKMPAGLFESVAPSTLASVGGALIVWGQRDADSLGLLRTAIELDPNQVDAQLVLARELGTMKDPEAEAIMRRVESEHPDRIADVLYLRGYFAAADGDTARALTELEKALTIQNRRQWNALILACEIRLERNELGPVRADLDRLADGARKVPELAPRSEALYIRYFLARADEKTDPQEKLEMLKEASAHCNTLLVMDNQSPQTLAWRKAIDDMIAPLQKQ